MTPRHVAQFEIPLDRLKDALGLPAEARILGIQYQAWWSGCLIQVEHSALPVVAGCAEPWLLDDWPAVEPSSEVGEIVAAIDADDQATRPTAAIEALRQAVRVNSDQLPRENSQDATAEILEHKRKVKYWMNDFVRLLSARAELHDNSKLEPPEKEIFDQYTWRLKNTEFGSADYQAQLAGMGEGLEHHYKNNRHHPEHFENGVNGMTLYDVVEMFCDWLAAAEAKRRPIDLDYLAGRFNLSVQLVEVLLNTLRDLDLWCEANGIPVTYFTPSSKRT